jgi:P2 family phage major capsid protein
MKDLTRQLFNQVFAALAVAYGVKTVGKQFAVAPEIEQRLQDKIVEMDTFLPLINVITVTEMEGENILGSASGPVSGRTDTTVDGQERTPRDVLGLENFGYKLYQTNSDVYMRYNTMDAWAKFKDLADRYTRYVLQRIANDRVTIGWYGTSAAADTNLTTNPLMQDVNKGWMQYMRDKKAANILTEGATEDEIRIGAGGDYENLDHAVADLTEGIPEYMRQDLVALVGSELVGMEKSTVYKTFGQTPSEKALAAASLVSFGGLSWKTPNNFPARGLVITSLKNLSIYVQEGTWRRHITDNPKKDRIEDYNSRNEGYVVETPEKFVGVEFANVKLKQQDDSWA